MHLTTPPAVLWILSTASFSKEGVFQHDLPILSNNRYSDIVSSMFTMFLSTGILSYSTPCFKCFRLND